MFKYGIVCFESIEHAQSKMNSYCANYIIEQDLEDGCLGEPFAG